MNFVIKSKKKAKKKLVKKNTIKKAKKIKRNKFSKKYNKKKNKSRKLKRGGGAGASKSYNDDTIIQIHNERDYINYSLISKINKLEDINKVKSLPVIPPISKILCDLFSIFYNIYANIIYNPKLYLDRIRDQTNIESELGILYTNPTLTISFYGMAYLNTPDNSKIDTRAFSTLTNIIKTFYKTIFDLGLLSKIKDTPERQERKLLSDQVKEFFYKCSTTEFIESIEVTPEILIELIAGLYKEFTYKDNEKYYNEEKLQRNIFFEKPVINISDSKLYEMSDLSEDEYIYSESIMKFRNKLNEILIYLNNPNNFSNFRSRTKPYERR